MFFSSELATNYISILIKTKRTFTSPYGRGAAVFKAGAENYGCGEGGFPDIVKYFANANMWLYIAFVYKIELDYTHQ